MKTDLSEYLKKMSDDNLYIAYQELLEYADTNELPEGVVRRLRIKYEVMNDTSIKMPQLELAIYKEIASRWSQGRSIA